MEKKNEMIVLAGLWKKETKNGEEFFTGSINGLSILIFKNKYKEKENHPDYKVYLAKKEKKETQEAGPTFNSNDEIPF